MSSYYHYNAHPHPAAVHPQSTSSSHHSGRGRRAPRLSQNQHHNNNKQQQLRSGRRDEEAITITHFRQRFEAGRSFDLDDDLEFCPNLVSEHDIVSIHSASSDRSSLSSGSPDSSPQSRQIAPDVFSLNSNSAPYVPTYQSQLTPLKLHQPAATRIRNAIPIVNPSTGVRMASPPHSVSPPDMRQQRRW